MNLNELENLITNGETDRLEFKRSTGQRTQATKTVCAMLNGLGGFVFFGVTDQGRIVGQEVSARTLEGIANEIRQIEPPAFPDMETVALPSGNAVIVLHISGSRGLYVFKGRSYIRNGPTTIQMPRTEYDRRLMEKFHSTRRWENEPVAEGVTVRDLDAEEIRITLDNAIRLGRLEPTGRRDIESILLGLELIREGHLLNAAVALYGNSSQLKSLYPQMGIRLGRFRGKDRLADFVDNRQYWGHAFSLLRRGESFLMDHVPIAGRVIPGKMVREDQPAYPPRATREALANAFCHRDYTIPGGAVAMAMYDDHLEITNPGALHFGITPEKLTKPHESRPWNPIIANVFYRAGIIERWGSGTLNILDWCTENRNPAPEWSEQTGSVYVSFLPALTAIRQVPGEDVPQDTPHVEPQVTPHVETHVALKMWRLLTVMKDAEDRDTLQRRLGLKARKNFRLLYLAPALSNGLIEMTLPEKPRSRNQRYRLTPKGKAWMKEYQKNK